jgi:hypothetical protein
MTTSGVAAMPGPRSNKAPYFSGKHDDPLANFLLEYKALAANNGLSSTEKVETITQYVPFNMHEFWRTLDSHGARNWAMFKANLESLYPDTSAATCHTKKMLQEFVNHSAKDCIRDEDDVIAYYQQFLKISNHLYNARELSDDDCNSEFFEGFHLDDCEVLAG